MASFLKKAKKFVPERSPKYLLHNYLSGMEDARPLSNIHASETTKPEGLCPRFYALHDVAKIKPTGKWVTTAENVTFELGRQLQDSVVNWFADMGRAVGHWKCMNCKTLHQFQLRPDKCTGCGCRAFKPEEVRFISPDTGISCGVDMLLKLDTNKLVPIELKTMDKDQFKTLAAPLAEHRLRTTLYLRIIAESEQHWANLVSPERAIIMYISKGGYGCADPALKEWGLTDHFSPLKEYEIARDDAACDAIVKPARAIRLFREGKIGMPTGICETALSKRASICPRKALCFSGDHPPQVKWQEAV